MIIAIDGTSGSGKSTLAKHLANKLNFGFFSAGAFYRAITNKALTLGIVPEDDQQLENMINTTKIIYSYNGRKNVMEVDGIDVSEHLHDEIISENVAKYSCKPYIRAFVRALQQDLPNHNDNIVMEGRDIGSVIFPNADLKLYVDCNVETRAKRRFDDLVKTDPNLSFEKVLEDLKDCDFRDTTREISPLVMCPDALLLDTSNMPLDKCIAWTIKQMKAKKLITKEFLDEKGIELS